jgi:CRISPR/Cas system-associated endonuclease Cas3-HD
MHKGQTTTSVIISVATLIGSCGGIGYLFNDIARANSVNANQGERIATVEEAIRCLPDMKEDIKETRDNMIKLMAAQGISPVARNIATTTSLK